MHYINFLERGKILSGEMKKMLQDAILEKITPMKERLERITTKEMASVIMKNDDVDVEAMIEKSGVMSEEAKKE